MTIYGNEQIESRFSANSLERLELDFRRGLRIVDWALNNFNILKLNKS